MDFEHHVRLGRHGPVAETAQGIEAGLPRGEVLDHHKIRLAREPFRAADAIERLRHTGPKLRGIFAGSKRDPLETHDKRLPATIIRSRNFAPAILGRRGERPPQQVR